MWQYSELLKLNVEIFQQKIWKHLSNPENCRTLAKSQSSGKPVIPRKSRMKHALRCLRPHSSPMTLYPCLGHILSGGGWRCDFIAQLGGGRGRGGSGKGKKGPFTVQCAHGVPKIVRCTATVARLTKKDRSVIGPRAHPASDLQRLSIYH